MTLYEEIALKIKRGIEQGLYKPGEKIPSIRQMAGELNCNKLTVQKAFEKLQRDGFLEKRVGSGSYVRFPESINQSRDIFDFKTSYISESLFPYAEAEKIFSKLFREEKSAVFSPPPVAGDPELMEILGEYYCVPTKRMFIISGAQQGLDLTAKVFSTRISDAILFEDPTYRGAISLFKAKHFVHLEEDGPDLGIMDEKLGSHHFDLFYSMPSVHNPTGISYGLAKKKAIIERAGQYPFYIIEDDYLSEYMEKRVLRFVDMFPEKTIYIKSLSQTTVSGIRLGFMVVPEDLYEKFLYTKYISDIASSGLLQKFIKEFIKSGEYKYYIEKTAKRIKGRKELLTGLIEDFPFLSIPSSQSGYGLWVKSNKKIGLPRLPWTKGDRFSFSKRHKDSFRISFMHMDDKTFQKALEYLKNFLSS